MPNSKILRPNARFLWTIPHFPPRKLTNGRVFSDNAQIYSKCYKCRPRARIETRNRFLCSPTAVSTMFCGAVLRSKPNQSLYEFVNVLSRISDLRMTFQTLCIDRDRVGAVRRPQIKSDEVGIPGVVLRQLSAITGAVAGRLSYRKMNVSPRQTWLREAHAAKAEHRGNYFPFTILRRDPTGTVLWPIFDIVTDSANGLLKVERMCSDINSCLYCYETRSARYNSERSNRVLKCKLHSKLQTTVWNENAKFWTSSVLVKMKRSFSKQKRNFEIQT